MFLAYTAGAYCGVPALVRHIAQNQAAAALHRPITLGEITFNPYTLRLSLADVTVAGRENSQPVLQVSRVRLRLSWTSFPKMALVLRQLVIEKPFIRIERVAPSTFNISDLFEGGTNKASLSFAISNIEVIDGVMVFNDRVQGKEHRLDNIRAAIPFLANLAADTDQYVQPMLQMRLDGTPISLNGKTKLFGGSLESVVEVNFQGVDLTPFAGYVSGKLPFQLKQAQLSAAVQLHFIERAGAPQLQSAGLIRLDNVALDDLRGSPLAEFKQLQAVITRSDPFTPSLELSSITIDSLSSHVVINHNGTTNLASLLGAPKTRPSPHPANVNAPARNANPAAPEGPQLLNPLATASPTSSGIAVSASTKTYATPSSSLRLSIGSLDLTNGELDVTDAGRGKSAITELQGVHFGLKNLATGGGTPARYNLTAKLKSGGHIAADGSFDLASVQATGNVVLSNVELHALQDLLARVLPASVESGELSARASLRATVGSQFNIHLEPADIALDGVELRLREGPQRILGWKHLRASLDRLDLIHQDAVVRELRSDRLHVTAVRDSRGNLNLTSLFSAQPGNQQAQNGYSQGAPPRWQYRVDSLVLENGEANIEDDTQPQPLSVRISPLNVQLTGLTNDFAQPFTFAVEGGMPRRGTFKLAGQTTLNPFQSRFHINADRIDLPSLQPAPMTAWLNAKLDNALLALNGDGQAKLQQGKVEASYDGGMALNHVRMSDKLTGTSFLRWYALNFDRLAVRYGALKPSIQIGSVTLSDFYAKLILNADGRLNLTDIVSSPSQPTVPISRPAIRPPVENAPGTPAFDIGVGSFTLEDGEVNYVDNFIKPNYSAVLTQVGGRVGSFGTNSTQAADLSLTAKVNGTSPISISGSINPLAPTASLDLEAKAKQIQLPPLAPYSAKYMGYPIVGGTLGGDVHYKLANRRLTATNHLILDQLSFGDRVENSTARNLPVRLAVAVLKDPQGRIDLRLPVSGSLADPEFDVGRVLWQGLLNVITKAAASPFAALASAVGGEHENLSYVEFAAGYSTLSDEGRDKLAKIATLLKDRPSLKLQITGYADPKIDRTGLREAMLDDQIRRRKAEDEHLTGPLEQVHVTPDQYHKYLWRVYKAADFAKPRDIVGMVKRVPSDEMKKSLLAHINVTDQDLPHLAEARASAVYQALATKIDSSRLQVAPPKINAEGISEGPTTRAGFSLS